ncbi:MAG: Flp family type IVb pilin [Terracidiphilus sp.]
MPLTFLKPDAKLQGLRDCEDGNDLLEFASLTALIALLCLAGVGNAASSLRTVFSNISNSLAAAGMNSVAMKSVPDGDETYSVKPAGTREERAAPLTAEREQIVVELQQKLDRDSEAGDKINVEEEGDELILTGPPAQDLPHEALRSKAAAELGDVSNDRLCSHGFRGVRVRSGPGSEGEYQSLHCGSASQ